MDALLQRHRIEVCTDLDRVVFIFKRLSFPMPYAMAFRISAALRLASKHAMRSSGETIKDWRERSRLDVYTSVGELNPLQRTTMTRKFEWRVDVDSEMVYLVLAEHKIGFHFETALKLAEWLRLGGKKAKRWAGDGSKSMVSIGRLADAEENYKRGF